MANPQLFDKIELSEPIKIADRLPRDFPFPEGAFFVRKTGEIHVCDKEGYFVEPKFYVLNEEMKFEEFTDSYELSSWIRRRFLNPYIRNETARKQAVLGQVSSPFNADLKKPLWEKNRNSTLTLVPEVMNRVLNNPKTNLNYSGDTKDKLININLSHNPETRRFSIPRGIEELFKLNSLRDSKYVSCCPIFLYENESNSFSLDTITLVDLTAFLDESRKSHPYLQTILQNHYANIIKKKLRKNESLISYRSTQIDPNFGVQRFD